MCSSNLCEGDRVSVWCDLDDHRKNTVYETNKKQKPEQGGVEKLADKALRVEAKKIKKAITKSKAEQDKAVLRGSALHKYRGRRLKLG